MSDLVHPVLRKAEFINPSRSLREATAKRIAESLKENSEQIINKNIDAIQHLNGFSNVGLCDSAKEHTARVVKEGHGAYVFDNPVIEAKWESEVFKIRSSVAVCYKGTTTKNWTRVTLENGISKNSDKLPRLKKVYNELAAVCCRTNHNIVSDLLEKSYKLSPVQIGDFTVMTFGVQDEKLGQYLDLFDDPDMRLKELFTTNPEVKVLFKDYFKTLFDKDEKYLMKEGANDFWMNSATSIVKKDGYLDNSNVIFKISLQDNSLFALGIGHDESRENELARLSSLAVARFYSKEI